MKGDLGALILDIMIANHAKADELSKNVLGFKDLFLLGFFLSISLSGPLSAATVVAAVIITPLILLKSAFFFASFAASKLRARNVLCIAQFDEFQRVWAHRRSDR